MAHIKKLIKNGFTDLENIFFKDIRLIEKNLNVKNLEIRNNKKKIIKRLFACDCL